MDSNRFYSLSEQEMDSLARIACRLYSEERMHGDEMRDCAQKLDATLDLAGFEKRYRNRQEARL